MLTSNPAQKPINDDNRQKIGLIGAGIALTKNCKLKITGDNAKLLRVYFNHWADNNRLEKVAVLTK
jgi:pantoate kinase